MSYSFNVQAATKEEAKAALEAEFDKVLTGQPAHEADLPAARVTAAAFVDALNDPAENEQVNVSVNGWVSVRPQGTLCGVCLGLQADIGRKAAV